MKKTIVFLFLFVASCLTFADFKSLNKALNLPLLNEEGCWQREDLEQALMGRRLKLNGNSVRRSVFLRNYFVFNEPAVELVIISDKSDNVTQVDIVFQNKGDSSDIKKMNAAIKKSYKTIKDRLTAMIGPAKRTDYGPKGMTNDALEWQDGNVKFVLEFNKKEYTILHIGYGKDYSAQTDTKKLKRDNFLENIVKKDNGDTYIDNIPMVDQGSKGYCATATLERVLRYYGITQVSQHQLADVADTGVGGGTPVDEMISGTKRLLTKYGLRIYNTGDLSLGKIKKSIDNGAPLLWWMRPNQEYNSFLRMSRMNRSKYTDLKLWLKKIKDYRIPKDGGSHMCLIVGYNEETEEIAVSNSWGDNDMQPAWVPLRLAKRVSYGHIYSVGAKR